MVKKISAKRVVLTSFFVDLLDIFINIFIAVITGSVVMVAELFQAIADLVSSAFLLIGLRRPKKEVFFWTLLSALVMLLFASSLSFYFGLKRFLNPSEISHIFLAYAALFIGTLSNGYAFWISAERILDGRPISFLIKAFRGSPFIMTKNTFVLDLMGTSAAVLGLVALILYQVFGNLKFDGLGAMAIGVVLTFLSVHLITNMRRAIKDFPSTKKS